LGTIFNFPLITTQEKKEKQPELWWGFGKHIYTQFRRRLDKDLGLTIAVVGVPRSGKSTVTSLASYRLDKRYITAPYPYEKPNLDVPPYRVLYRSQLFFPYIRLAAPYSSTNLDELGLTFTSQEWYLNVCKAFAETVEAYGYLKIPLFANMPQFMRGINRFRDVTTGVFKVVKRGVAKLYKLKPTGFGKTYLKTIGYLVNIPPPEKVFPEFWGLPYCRECGKRVPLPTPKYCPHCNAGGLRRYIIYKYGTYQWKKIFYNEAQQRMRARQVEEEEFEDTHFDLPDLAQIGVPKVIEPDSHELHARAKRLPKLQFERTADGEAIPVDDSMRDEETIEGGE